VRAGAKKPRPRGPIEPDELERLALRYLDRFDCSVQKLRTHLAGVIRRRGGDREILGAKIDSLLERYQASGLLNDARFAGNLAERLQERGGSRRAIVEKLRRRGVTSGVAQAAIKSSPASELEAARAFVRKRRLGPYRPEAEREENRRRDLAALARTGFDHDTAIRALGYGRDDDF
jgi:regulatory protein